MAEKRRRKKKVVAKRVTKKKVTKAARKPRKKKRPGGTTMERAAQMSEMRAEGYTFETIAKEFGVTRQRVHQLVSGASDEAPKADKKQGNNHSPNPELLRGRGVQEKIKQYDAASRDASEVKIGDRLVYMRMKRGLTIGQLSQESEVPYGVLSTYENNKAQPSCDSLRKLCTALEISAHWLLFGETETDIGGLQAEVKKWKQRAIRLRKELAASQAD